MNALKTVRWVGLAVALLWALAGCGGGGAGGGDTGAVIGGAGGEPASLDLSLSSYARSGGSSTQTFANTASAQGQVLVTGQLLVHNQGSGQEDTYNWALTVDENAFRIATSVTLNLDKGTYDLYFLMRSGTRFYAGVQKNWVVLGTGGTATNTIPFVLNPVISSGDVSIASIQSLEEFKFKYDFKTVQAYADPAFSIAVDGGTENVFSINPNASAPYVFVLLPPGKYLFTIKFYDGSTVTLYGDQTVDVPIENGTELSLQPLAATVNYELPASNSPQGTPGTITFTVPSVIVQEGGSAGTLVAHASVVGPKTDATEDDITLQPTDNTGSAYQGVLSVPGLTQDQITYAIQFRTQGGVLYAYCAGTGNISGSQGSFACVPHLISQAVTGSEQPARVTVNVTDYSGVVPGVVISAGPSDSTLEPVGITSQGGLQFEVAGEVQSFLPGGVYKVKGQEQLLDSNGQPAGRSADAAVALVPGQNTLVNLDFGSPPPPPPPPPDTGDDDQGDDNDNPGAPTEDFITVVAQLQNWPKRYLDGSVRLSTWTQIRIPDLVNVTVDGDPNRFLLLLSFGGRDLRCWYLGGSDSSELLSWLGGFATHTFSNPVCTNGKKAGDTYWVHGPIRARVLVGSKYLKTTEVTVNIPVVAARDPEGHRNDSRPGWWRGHGRWHWWGWWYDGDDFHGSDDRHGVSQGDNHGNGGDDHGNNNDHDNRGRGNDHR